MRERGEHVEQGDGLADFEEGVDLGTDGVDESLHGAVAEGDHVGVCVADLLVHFDQFEGLAFDEFGPPVGVDEDRGQRIVVEVGPVEAQVVLASGVEFQVDGKFVVV